MLTLLTVGSIVLGIAVFFAVNIWVAGALALLGVVGAISMHSKLMRDAKELCDTRCVCVTPAVDFIDWYGSQQSFDIASAEYAIAFMKENERKLVNLSPQAIQLLEMTTGRSAPGGQQSARRYET